MSDIVDRAILAALKELIRQGPYLECCEETLEAEALRSDGEIGIDGRVNLRSVVRATIEAMRKPTKEMLDAAREAEIAYDPHECIPPRLAWPAMIDAALRD